MKDILGNEYVRCGVILTDPTFERRLKAFDQRLELVFDQFKKKWVILEWSPPSQAYNRLIVCEDDEGNPKPLGQWIFQKLYVWRHNYEVTSRNIDQRWLELENERDEQIKVIDKNVSNNLQAIIGDGRNLFRKINRYIRNEPISDVTAGYPKV